MIYAITYELVGVLGPGGIVDSNLGNILDQAKHYARLALDQLDDHVNFAEWHDLSGNSLEPHELLDTKTFDELTNQISQINDELQSNNLGYLGFWEHQDIFQLISEHDVTSWCSESLKKKILNTNREYHALIHEISEEWNII